MPEPGRPARTPGLPAHITGDPVVRQSVTSLSEINNGCNPPGGLTSETGTVTVVITG